MLSSLSGELQLRKQAVSNGLSMVGWVKDPRAGPHNLEEDLMRVSSAFVFGFLGSSSLARQDLSEFCDIIDCNPQGGRHG